MTRTRGLAQRGTWSLLAVLGVPGCGSAAHPSDDAALDAGDPSADAGTDAGEMCDPSCPLQESDAFLDLRLDDSALLEGNPELELDLDLTAATRLEQSGSVLYAYPTVVEGQAAELALSVPAGFEVATLPAKVRYREAVAEAPCRNGASEEEFSSASILRDADGELLFASFHAVANGSVVLALPLPELTVSQLGSMQCWSCDEAKEAQPLILGFLADPASADALIVQGVRPDLLSVTIEEVPYKLKVEKSSHREGEGACSYVSFSLARADLVSSG